MQQQARGAGENLGRGVEFVAEDGVADGLKVHAQLVRAAGFREEVDARGIERRVVADDAQAGERGLADGVVNHLARAVGPVGDQRQVDHALARVHAPGDQRHVALFHPARLEQPVEGAVHVRAARQHQQARCAEVEPVHRQRLRVARLDTGAQAILLARPPPRH